jgi:tetratricopeptide (TPR) repeat protein
MDETIITKIDLATVAKSVAETDRRRALVEEKLNQAQSVVESLNAESKSLQESVLELKHDLEETTKAKDQEAAELTLTIGERKRAIEEVKTLASAADELRTASEQKSAAIGTNVEVARKELDSLEASVEKSGSDAKSLDEMVTQLRSTVTEARRQAESMESQLKMVGETTKSAVIAANEIKGRISDARAALDVAVGRKNETDETCSALGAITSALRKKTTEAIVAVKAIDDLITEQTQQSSTLATRLAAVAKLVGQPEHKNGSSAIAPSPNGAHAAGPSNQFAHAVRTIALLDLERLISHDEAERLTAGLRAGNGERALRDAWALTSGSAMSAPHRLVFGEVLSAMGDVKAAIIYYEQAASAKNVPPVVRYLASLAYMRMDLIDRSTFVAQLLARDRGGKLLNRIVDALRAEQTGDADHAADLLTEAAYLRGFPKWEYDEAYFQLGGLHERRNDIEAAVAAYEKVTSTTGPYADVVERVRSLF